MSGFFTYDESGRRITSACTTCGGYGNRHDPIAHSEWVTCSVCKGEGVVRRDEFDVDCPRCDGDGGWEP